MQERPDGPDLLAAARETLLSRLLPALPAALQYEARMVANAMAIAARQAEVPEAAFTALMPGEADGLAALVAAIRAGAFAPGTGRHAECAAFLRAFAEARARVSNPRALDRR
jgi:hypothetical protein